MASLGDFLLHWAIFSVILSPNRVTFRVLGAQVAAQIRQLNSVTRVSQSFNIFDNFWSVFAKKLGDILPKHLVTLSAEASKVGYSKNVLSKFVQGSD